jgi:tRNA 2-thiouridine synthesizing protein D
MIISITVHGRPVSSQSARSALRFAKAAAAGDHELYRVFFYHDAVHLADTNVVTPQDESALLDEWLAFADEVEIELAVCIAACLKRGIINEEERERYDRAAANAHPSFAVVGLGQLIEAAMVSDRLITFAA